MKESVAPILRPALQPAVETVRKRFRIWRKKGPAKRRIPTGLWDQAVGLCRDHSLSKVSRALRLNYDGLKNRVHKTQDIGLGSDIGFVKLDLGAPLVSSAEWRVEMEASNGAKMTLSVKGTPGDLVELSRVFWSQGQ